MARFVVPWYTSGLGMILRSTHPREKGASEFATVSNDKELKNFPFECGNTPLHSLQCPQLQRRGGR